MKFDIRNPPTAVGVDKFGVNKADFEVVEHGWFMEVAKGCEVILAHQDVRVSQVRQVLRLGVQLVVDILGKEREAITYMYNHMLHQRNAV